MNREELEHETKLLKLGDALDAAKEKAFKSKSDADLNALKKAETALADYRRAYRSQRDGAVAAVTPTMEAG